MISEQSQLSKYSFKLAVTCVDSIKNIVAITTATIFLIESTYFGTASNSKAASKL
jgi:hypothetical protein